jgi:DNA-binding response OmpR family regulator
MKERILIIDDDKSVRSNLKILLTEEGYQVLTAEDGNLGIIIAKEMIPNLIICDIMMPGIDGYEVLKKLLSLPETSTIPFIFLSAKTDEADLRKGMLMGADDYLFKPYKARDFLKTVKIRLNKFERIKTKINSIADTNIRNQDKFYTSTDSIFLKTNNKSRFVKVKSIKFISAVNQYSNIGLEDGNNFIIRKPLARWEKVLPQNEFLRIHRSTIINLDYIKKVEKKHKDSFTVHLKNSIETFIMSRRYASKIKSGVLEF